LQVYPAAGLIDYVHPAVPKYIIDKKIPPVNRYENIVVIEKSATEGVGELLKILNG
jgi:NAD-dependent deacetylase